MLIDSLKIIGNRRIANTQTFSEVGDEQPMHSHPAGQEHMSFVRKDSHFYVWGEDPKEPGKIIWERTLGPGDMIVFEADKPHAIRALTAGSKLTHIPF